MALSGVEELLSMASCATPREIVEALNLAICEMKTHAMEVCSSCAEIDTLPLFVFVLVQSPISHPAACVRLLGDALTAATNMDQEAHAINLLAAAIQRVSHELDLSYF